MTAVSIRTGEFTAIVDRARSAALEVEYWDQQQVDQAVVAVGWQCYREDNARAMAMFGYRSTGLGDPEEMYSLQRRRVLGILRDLNGVTTTGIVDEQPGLGITRFAKPVGVIAATCPATAPCSTAICITLPMLKTRNAVILIPSPRGLDAVQVAVEAMRKALKAAGAPEDLVQCVPECTRESAIAFMQAADLVVATGGERALRRAHSTGTPAIGAGIGNATAIVDETADLADAAQKIAIGSSLNNGTSCSSESNVLVEASVREAFIDQLLQAGVHLCDAAQAGRLRALLWPNGGRLDRSVVGKPAEALCASLGIESATKKVRSLAVPVIAFDPRENLLGEKLSPVFTLIPYDGFDTAVRMVQQILDGSGSGHSCGIHTSSDQRVMMLARRIRSARVLVNQSVGIGNSGSYDNGLPFSTTVACGSWGGCGQSENITWRNYLNYTTVSRPISCVLPDENMIFGKLMEVPYASDCDG